MSFSSSPSFCISAWMTSRGKPRACSRRGGWVASISSWLYGEGGDYSTSSNIPDWHTAVTTPLFPLIWTEKGVSQFISGGGLIHIVYVGILQYSHTNSEHMQSIHVSCMLIHTYNYIYINITLFSSLVWRCSQVPLELHTAPAVSPSHYLLRNYFKEKNALASDGIKDTLKKWSYTLIWLIHTYIIT